jgi:hypothetical protein
METDVFEHPKTGSIALSFIPISPAKKNAAPQAVLEERICISLAKFPPVRLQHEENQPGILCVTATAECEVLCAESQVGFWFSYSRSQQDVPSGDMGSSSP